MVQLAQGRSSPGPGAGPQGRGAAPRHARPRRGGSWGEAGVPGARRPPARPGHVWEPERGFPLSPERAGRGRRPLPPLGTRGLPALKYEMNRTRKEMQASLLGHFIELTVI